MKRVVEDDSGALYEVTNLYNIHSKQTQALDEAVSCVVVDGQGSWAAFDLRQVTVHTIH